MPSRCSTLATAISPMMAFTRCTLLTTSSIVRPAWLMDEDEVNYETTAKGQPFKGTVVSRKSVADLIAQVIASPKLHVGENLGVNKPNSDGDKPYFM
ncbi:MAG: NAD(P)H-binding protein [Janthinobacterium sp.]